MKWLFWLLLAANLAFFATMQWGELLTGDHPDLSSQPPLNEQKIKLLSAPPEAHVSAPPSPDVNATPPLLPEVLAQVPPPPAAPAAPQENITSGKSCLEWGEFSGNDLKRAAAALAPLKLGSQLSRRQVEYISGYWAYIPPPKSRAEIDKKINVLKARGIADYFVVQEPGKWQNAISLGVFKTREAAQKFLDKLSAKGIKTPVIGERMTKLKFTVFVIHNPDAAAIEKISELHRTFDGSELRPVDCK